MSGRRGRARRRGRTENVVHALRHDNIDCRARDPRVHDYCRGVDNDYCRDTAAQRKS